MLVKNATKIAKNARFQRAILNTVYSANLDFTFLMDSVFRSVRAPSPQPQSASHLQLLTAKLQIVRIVNMVAQLDVENANQGFRDFMMANALQAVQLDSIKMKFKELVFHVPPTVTIASLFITV